VTRVSGRQSVACPQTANPDKSVIFNCPARLDALVSFLKELIEVVPK
jgi:hypothetical protein